MRRFWRYGWAGLLLLPAMAWGGFPEHYSEVLAAMRPYHGICWEIFPAHLTSECMTSDRIWANAVRRSPCGSVTLLPGESLSLADISEKDCTHRKGFHDHGPFQAVLEHTFLVRLMAMDGRSHDFAFELYFYAGAPSSGSGTCNHWILYDFGPSSKELWYIVLASSQYDSFFEGLFPLVWDGRTLYGAVIPYGGAPKGAPQEASPAKLQRYHYRLWTAPSSHAATRSPVRWWEAFAKDTLRACHVHLVATPPSPVFELSDFPRNYERMLTWLSPDESEALPPPINVPAGTVFSIAWERNIRYLLRVDGTPSGILVSGLPYVGSATLYNLRWEPQKVFEGCDDGWVEDEEGYYRLSGSHYRWDGNALTLQARMDVGWDYGRETVYRDFPLSVSFREVREGEWGPVPEAGKRDWLRRPPALADILPADLNRRLVVKGREANWFPAYDTYDTYWIYDILLDGKPQRLYVFPDRRYAIPGVTPIPQGRPSLAAAEGGCGSD